MIKTTSLETSKFLKDAGFRQDTYFQKWIDHPADAVTSCIAPTTDELLDELPKFIEGQPLIILPENNAIGGWIVKYHIDFRIPLYRVTNKSLPEALASMWLWLKKEGLI